MSFHATATLQAAVFQRLAGWPGLAGIPVVDGMPAGTRPATFVLLGPEVAVERGDGSGGGAEHRLVISVISTAAGFLAAKTAAAEVSLALADAELVLTTGRLVSLAFQRAAAARREAGAVRRIDLTFRARIEF